MQNGHRFKVETIQGKNKYITSRDTAVDGVAQYLENPELFARPRRRRRRKSTLVRGRARQVANSGRRIQLTVDLPSTSCLLRARHNAARPAESRSPRRGGVHRARSASMPTRHATSERTNQVCFTRDVSI